MNLTQKFVCKYATQQEMNLIYVYHENYGNN
jgi:hypothetical protein